MTPTTREPHVGQGFESIDKLLELVRRYATASGFKVRKERCLSSRSNNFVYRDIVCSHAGRAKAVVKRRRNRGSNRCDCPFDLRAYMVAGGCQITCLRLKHNHRLLSPKEMYLIPSYRSIIATCTTPLERNAALLITPYAMSLFHKQIEMTSEYECIEMESTGSNVRRFCIKRNGTDGHTVECTLEHGSYEFKCNSRCTVLDREGIACRHICKAAMHVACKSLSARHFALRRFIRGWVAWRPFTTRQSSVQIRRLLKTCYLSSTTICCKCGPCNMPPISKGYFWFITEIDNAVIDPVTDMNPLPSKLQIDGDS